MAVPRAAVAYGWQLKIINGKLLKSSNRPPNQDLSNIEKNKVINPNQTERIGVEVGTRSHHCTGGIHLPFLGGLR